MRVDPREMTTSERDAFWARVDIRHGDECWPWRLGGNDEGYGRHTVRGKQDYAHRIALGLRLGRPIEPDCGALHVCDNPPCCNPRHLYEGTNADNRRDCVVRGRSRSREALTGRQVQMVRELRGTNAQVLARAMGVSNRTIYRVWNADQQYVRRLAA